MASTWVLKFPQVDLPKQPFLVHVTQKKGLDLDLLATDGEVAYRGKLRDRSLAKLKASNYGGSDEEWKAILHHALVFKSDSGISQAQQESLDVQCAVSGKGSKAVLSIAFRTKIEDITSRLGSVELTFSDDTDDVDLFGWTASVIDQRDGLSARAVDSRSSQDTMQANITSLQQELNDLINAKNEYEKQLLSKFSVLLNDKKEKIRNQQRILSSAKVDPRKLEELQSTLNGHQQSGVSNSKKRKGKSSKSRLDDEESDGFEAMDIDNAPAAKATMLESDEDSQGEATASGSEDEGGPIEAVRESVTKQKQLNSSEDTGELPPPRTLPFQEKGEKRNTKVASASTNQTLPSSNTIADDEETASEDDEL